MIGAYLQAFLRRYAGAAWKAAAPGSLDIVQGVYTHDPEQYFFKVEHLPALYLFRTDGAPTAEQITADVRYEEDTVRVFWVLPPADQLKQPGRARAISRVGRFIKQALLRGQDPSFVIDGDTDPQAATWGSVVIRHAGLTKLDAGKWRTGRLAIRPPGNVKHDDWNVGLYDHLAIDLTIREALGEVPNGTAAAAQGPYFTYPPARVSATVTANESEETAVEYRDPLTLIIP